jgi:hypothetical protein
MAREAQAYTATYMVRNEKFCLSSGFAVNLKACMHQLSDKKVYRQAPEPWHLQPKQYLAASLLTGAPMLVLFYWGISPRGSAGPAERNAFAFLSSNLDRLSAAVQTAWEIDIIFTDTHAVVNGVGSRVIESYCRSAMTIFEGPGRRFTRMSEALGIKSDKDVLSVCAEFRRQNDLFDSLPIDVVSRLVQNADRHSIRDAPELAARNYVAISQIEAPLVRREYSRSLQVTYYTPHMAWILPALPTLYIYVGENRKARRPWFDLGK